VDICVYSKFIEEAVRWRIFHQTVRKAREAFAGVSPSGLLFFLPGPALRPDRARTVTCSRWLKQERMRHLKQFDAAALDLAEGLPRPTGTGTPKFVRPAPEAVRQRPAGS
jgi:hypothetical protein